MNCPICGLHLCMVFHEWRASENIAFFEYHHSLEDGLDEKYRREPCELKVPFMQGLERYEEEWKEMYKESGDDNASEVSQTV